MLKIILSVLILFFTLFNPHSSGADTTPLTLKATFILKFIGFVEFNKKPSVYQIGYMGSPETYAEFSQVILSKEQKKLKFEVIHLTPKSDLSLFNILYFEGDQFPSHLAMKDVQGLIISDNINGLAKGAIINFITTDETMGFEINNKKAQDLGIKINSRLLNLAKRVIQ